MDSGERKAVKMAVKGDKKSFEFLLKKHYEQIYRTAFLYVRNEQNALDAVQEAAYQAFMSIHSLKKPEYFMTWLTKIVIRCSAAILRQGNKVVPIEEERLAGFMGGSDEKQEEPVLLLDALERLKENYRTAIILFYYYDYPIKTISEIMKIPEGTVKTYLSRGKAALKKYFSGEEEGTWIERN